MGSELMSKEIKVDPGCRSSANGAAEKGFVEVTSGCEIGRRKREVKGSEGHKVKRDS